MRLRPVLSALFVSSLALAQAPTHISPVAAAGTLGNTNSNIPFSWNPTAYQQVHSGSSFSNPSATLVTQMRLRMASRFTNRMGATIDVELFMARSPNDAASASRIFGSNVTGIELKVFARKLVTLPQVPDNSWAVAPFPFDVPFPFIPGHLSWRAIVYGNSLVNQVFIYPLDAWLGPGPSVTVPVGTGCKAGNGTSVATHTVSGLGLGGNAQYVGSSFVPGGGLPALLTIGTSRSSFQGTPLPFSLSAAGAPGCSVYNNWTLVLAGVTNPGAAGDVMIAVHIPNDQALASSTHYSQYLFASPGANTLGAFTTNGVASTFAGPIGVARIYYTSNPGATSGTLENEFGIAIGLN